LIKLQDASGIYATEVMLNYAGEYCDACQAAVTVIIGAVTPSSPAWSS